MNLDIYEDIYDIFEDIYEEEEMKVKTDEGSPHSLALPLYSVHISPLCDNCVEILW